MKLKLPLCKQVKSTTALLKEKIIDEYVQKSEYDCLGALEL